MYTQPCFDVRRSFHVPLCSPMDIAAWPSIEPAMPFSACSSADFFSESLSVKRKRRTRAAIMIGPPINSAAAKCHEISTHISTPSSSTRFVAANWKAIAAVKSPPLRTMERAIATAAYEQDDDAAPSALAFTIDLAEASGNSRDISPFDIATSTTAEKIKPRERPQKMSQNIVNAIHRAWPI